MRQVEVGMIRRLVERLKNKIKPKEKEYASEEKPEYASEPDCADCPDYDDCANPWICIATIDD
jgi:hypothetical protein